MVSLLRRCAPPVTTCFLLVLFFAVPQALIAQTHVVSPAELQKATIAATQARQQNIETIRQFMSSTAAQKGMKSAQIDPEQVKQAVSSLSDEELAQLASRASKAQADFAAGHLSERDLIIILIVIAALILIIVAVH
jgi:UPF0716 family protein affecting phage T7 exclusion